jgi:hypothetical protein
MGQHTSARTEAGRFGWRRAVIVAVSIGVAFGTIGVVGLASGTTTPTPSVYSAVAPVTVLGRSLAANSNTDVTVAGVDSVPSNATSVQLSVTALDGTATSSMYVYPTGATQPTSANVRWTTGETVTIPVTVAVGTAGKVRLTTDGGTVTVKVAVVGYFSPTPAPGPAGYAAEVGSVAIIDEEDGGTTIASLDVPAGTYEVQFKASMSLGSSASDSVICYLEGPASETIDDVTMYLASGTHEGIMSLVGLDTTTGGALTAYCYDTDSSVDAYNVQLVAVQLSSATGAVAGG